MKNIEKATVADAVSVLIGEIETVASSVLEGEDTVLISFRNGQRFRVVVHETEPVQVEGQLALFNTDGSITEEARP